MSFWQHVTAANHVSYIILPLGVMCDHVKRPRGAVKVQSNGVIRFGVVAANITSTSSLSNQLSSRSVSDECK